MIFQDIEAAILLANAGWRETPSFVDTSCLACRKKIGPGERVYTPSLKNAWAAYCPACGVHAEQAVARKTAEEPAA